MNQSDPDFDPVTLVISEIVKPDRIQEYEAWTRGINHAAREFEGYLGANIIRPRDHAFPEYVTIVKFDNYAHFRTWQVSPICQEWLAKAKDLVDQRVYQRQSYEPEMWFTLSRTATNKPKQPAYYKQVIVGAIAVYPLILLANTLLGPILKGLHPQLALLMSVFFVSALLTYPVMPWLTRTLSFWLYPKR
ncbi:MAG: antibiotic biosynthesis monooxygenase [Oscillatoriales cyanobacterium C42_A2020_001]|nr:antibiotic biosynthesis monooxygenase [Leptolyngbyaceae cyanobacterium C42_A2020_001]